MAWVTIASEQISRKREDGTVHTFDYTLQEEDGAADAMTIGLVGTPLQATGEESDDPTTDTIKPTQVQFAVRDTNRQLLARLGQPNTRHRLLIDESTGVGPVTPIFDGYLIKKTIRHSVFSGTPAFEVTAYDGIGLLQGVPVAEAFDPQAFPMYTLREIAEVMISYIGTDLAPDFYSSWLHTGRAATDPFPEQLRFNVFKMQRWNKNPTLMGLLKELCSQFNFQVFIRRGRLVFADRAERILNPGATRYYRDDGAGGTSTGAEDLRVSLGEDTSIRRPQREGYPGARRIVARWDLGRRAIGLLVNPDFSAGGDGWDANQVGFDGTYAYMSSQTSSFFSQRPSAIYAAGDEVRLIASGRMRTDGEATGVSGEWDLLRIHAETGAAGEDLWLNNAGQWVSEETFLTRPFSASTVPEFMSWSFDIDSDPLPEGFEGTIRYEALFRVRMDSGSPTVFLQNQVTELRDESRIVAGAPEAKNLYVTNKAETRSYPELVFRQGLSDADARSDLFPIEVWDGAGWVAATNWDATQIYSGAFPEYVQQFQLSALAKAYMSNGTPDLIEVRARDIHAPDMLSAIRFDDGDGPRTFLPVYWERELHSGYVRVIAAEGIWDQDVTPSGDYGATRTDEDSVGEGSAGIGTGSGSPGSSSPGVTDHGNLSGLSGDDHPHYLTAERGDVRYPQLANNLSDYNAPTARDNLGLGENDDVTHKSLTVNHVTLNNPATSDTHALRAGQVLSTNAPLSGGGKLREGLTLQLNYDAQNLKITAGQLTTAQAIHTGADVRFKSVKTDTGVTIDDAAGYVGTETFSGGFGGQGAKLQLVDGKWIWTVDNLVVRNRMDVYEIMRQQLRTGANFLLNEGHRVEQVQQVLDGSWSFNDEVDVFSPAADPNLGFADWHECRLPADTLLSFQVGDLIKRQEFSGRAVGVTDATVVAAEYGSSTVTDNSTPRSFTVFVDEGDPPAPGMDFARMGHRSDPARQNGIIITASGSGNPYQRVYAGVDRHARFGAMDTIRSQSGRLDNIVDADFPDLDGSQQNLYGTYQRGNSYVKGHIVVTGGNAETKDGALAKAQAAESSAKDYTDALQAVLDGILADAVTNGTTIIEGGFLKNSLINTQAIVVGDLGDGADYETKLGAQAKVNSLQQDLDDILDNAVANGTTIITGGVIASQLLLIKDEGGATIISGGVLQNKSIKTEHLDVVKLDAITANTGALTVDDTLTMGAGGKITNANNSFLLDEIGYKMSADQSGVNSISWYNGDYNIPSNLIGHVYSYYSSLEDLNLLIVRAQAVGVSDSKIFLTSGELQIGATKIFLRTFLPSSDPVNAGQVYTRTAAQLGGAGTEKVLCVSVGGAPGTPSQPSICKQANALIISWDAAAGADSYTVQRSVGGGSFSNWKTGEVGTSVADVDPIGSPDTTYQYRVEAVNSTGGSGFSPPSSLITWNTASAC